MSNILNNIDINGMIIAAATLTLSGIIGFWLKDFPKYLSKFILKMITTEVLIDNQCGDAYYNIIAYIERNYSKKKFRKYKIDNSWTYDGMRYILSIGYGNHFIIYKHNIFCINLDYLETPSHNLSRSIINKIRIIKLGRNNAILKTFIEDCSIEASKYKIEGKIEIQAFTNNEYRNVIYANKRSTDTIYLNQGIDDKIFGAINNFINGEEWYINNGIPYHLGIFLYGPPGTGKTSIIKAIASKYDLAINYISSSNIEHIQEMIADSNIYEKHNLYIFEDIDSCNMVHDRNNQFKQSDNKSKINLSDILNIFDGIMSKDGSIIICTTNKLDDIDPALFRPGRIDLLTEIGYMDRYAINKFLMNFYKKSLPKNTSIRSDITCAKLQNLVLEKASYNDIVNYISTKQMRDRV